MSEVEGSIAEETIRRWNSEADEHNQWSELGQDEKDEQFELTRALRVGRNG